MARETCDFFCCAFPRFDGAHNSVLEMRPTGIDVFQPDYFVPFQETIRVHYTPHVWVLFIYKTGLYSGRLTKLVSYLVPHARWLSFHLFICFLGEEGCEGRAKGTKKDQDQEACQAAAHQAHVGKQEEVKKPTMMEWFSLLRRALLLLRAHRMRRIRAPVPLPSSREDACLSFDVHAGKKCRR